MTQKVYKDKSKFESIGGVVRVWGKKITSQSLVYFEEPKLQESYEKYLESTKKLSSKDKKILIKGFED